MKMNDAVVLRPNNNDPNSGAANTDYLIGLTANITLALAIVPNSETTDTSSVSTTDGLALQNDDGTTTPIYFLAGSTTANFNETERPQVAGEIDN
jgi:hypothetical protein